MLMRHIEILTSPPATFNLWSHLVELHHFYEYLWNILRIWPSKWDKIFGAIGIRTLNLLHAKQLLSHWVIAPVLSKYFSDTIGIEPTSSRFGVLIASLGTCVSIKIFGRTGKYCPFFYGLKDHYITLMFRSHILNLFLDLTGLEPVTPCFSILWIISYSYHLSKYLIIFKYLEKACALSNWAIDPKFISQQIRIELIYSVLQTDAVTT